MGEEASWRHDDEGCEPWWYEAPECSGTATPDAAVEPMWLGQRLARMFPLFTCAIGRAARSQNSGWSARKGKSMATVPSFRYAFGFIRSFTSIAPPGSLFGGATPSIAIHVHHGDGRAARQGAWYLLPYGWRAAIAARRNRLTGNHLDHQREEIATTTNARRGS